MKNAVGLIDIPEHVINTHLKVVKLLLKKGAYVNAKCKSGYIPLDFVNGCECQAICKLLKSYQTPWWMFWKH